MSKFHQHRVASNCFLVRLCCREPIIKGHWQLAVWMLNLISTAWVYYCIYRSRHSFFQAFGFILWDNDTFIIQRKMFILADNVHFGWASKWQNKKIHDLATWFILFAQEVQYCVHHCKVYGPTQSSLSTPKKCMLLTSLSHTHLVMESVPWHRWKGEKEQERYYKSTFLSHLFWI